MKNLARNMAILTLTTSIILLSAGCDQKAKRPASAKIGQLAPNLVLKDLQGKSWDLDTLKGKVVFINFWATWCSPCRTEMPSMQRLFTSLDPTTFVMLSILSNDEPAFADKVAQQMGITFPILDDPDGSIGRAYGITGVPETYIVDKDGILRESYIGPFHWDSPDAYQMIKKYINQ